jgi:uncharacterized membrane protein
MVFLVLGILQHYIKFDSRTMAIMEKLLGMGSFGITMGHLACRYVILPTSLRGLGLPLMVRLVVPTILGCWTLIAFTRVTCCQRNDHHILFNLVAHVETNIFPF